jgi:hypothetical protein
VSGHALGLRRRRLTPRLLDEPPPLRVPLEEEVEPGLEDLLGAPAGVRVGERGASGLELLEEAAGDGDVQPAQFGGERHDLVRRAARRGGRRCRLGGSWFIQVNCALPLP